MTPFEKIYSIVSFIPKGKVSTYKEIAKIAGVNNPRIVGFTLHANKNPQKIPCHRVVGSNGKLRGYALGGIKKKKEILEKEGVLFLQHGNVDIRKSIYKFPKPLVLYFELLFKFGYPGPWPWHKINKTKGPPHTPDEIIIGAILTQNTNWRNVNKSLKNLKKGNINTLKAIYILGKNDLQKLKELIKPSGFYNQKGERLLTFSRYIIENYKSLANFFKNTDVDYLRKELLELKGIGEETADTILLYAGKKPVFVIDAYTKRFCKSKRISYRTEYTLLQKLFIQNLPKDVNLYQDYHALIVGWGKTNGKIKLA